MKKIFSVVALCLSTSATMFAGPIQAGKAQALASNFFGTSQGDKSVKITYRAKADKNAGAENLYYVINKGTDQGFVVISGDDRTMPILAYADQGTLTEEAIQNHPSIKWMFEEYANQIEWAKNNMKDEPSESYKALEQRRITPKNADIIVKPLLAYENDRITLRSNPVAWGQDWPFNTYCPTLGFRSSYTGGVRYYPTVSGCVATAIATVMRWHEWPAKAKGTLSYKWKNKTMSLNFDGVYGDGQKYNENKPYDWSNMPEAVTSRGYRMGTTTRLNETEEDNIGRLLRDVGYAVRMNYGIAADGGSGTQVYYAPTPLVNNFSYKKGLKHLYRNRYTEAEWIEEIKDEMQNYGPVVYAGISKGGGHCFVLDGLAKNNYVHVNWGWNAQEDGWYLLNILEPGSEGIGGGGGGYQTNQQMLRYMTPDRGIDPNPNPDPKPTPNPDPTPETKAPLYIIAKSTLAEVAQETANVYVTVGNNHSEYYYGTFKLSAKKEGTTTYTDLATTNYAAYISASGSRELHFTADFSKLAAGTYDLRVSYVDNESWMTINESAGTVKVKGAAPQLKGAELVALSTASANFIQGESGQIQVSVSNNGDEDFSNRITLFANGVEISAGSVNIGMDETVTLNFATNEAFKTLAVGTYQLQVAYEKNGKNEFIKLNGNSNLGILTISPKKETPKPTPTPGAAKGDMKVTSAQFYQNGRYLGSNYSTVAKATGSFAARVYVYSFNGFEGSVKFFVTDSYRGVNGISSAYEVTKEVKLTAGQSGYVEVEFSTSDLTGVRYYINGIYNDGSKDVISVSSSVPFYVSNYRGYRGMDSGFIPTEGMTKGIVYEIDGDMAFGSEYRNIGFDENDTNVTGIEEINTSVSDGRHGGIVARYNVNGQQVTAAQKGVQILKYADGTSRKVILK